MANRKKTDDLLAMDVKVSIHSYENRTSQIKERPPAPAPLVKASAQPQPKPTEKK